MKKLTNMSHQAQILDFSIPAHSLQTEPETNQPIKKETP